MRLSALGDVVHALPMLDALRRGRPDAEIGWLVEEGAASLLEDHPQLDRLWIAPRQTARRLRREGKRAEAVALVVRRLRELRAASYELVIDAQCNLRSTFWSRGSGAPHRIGFAPPFTQEKAHW
ncbi:MAG: glycosyltransferase family 9 protein, partial [Myxococcota bacterium]